MRQIPGGGGISPPPMQNEAARKAMLQSNMMQAQKNPLRQMPTKAANDNQENQQEEEDQEEEQKTSLRSAMQMKGIIAQNLGAQMEQDTQTAAQGQAQVAAQQAAKKMAPKAITFLISIASDAIGAGTAGVGYLVTIFPKLAILFWWNMQMFLGIYLFKRKSKLIPPLDWEPIRIMVSIDPKALLFQFGVLLMDVVLLVIMAIIVGLIASIIYLLTHPCDALTFIGPSWTSWAVNAVCGAVN